MCIRDRPSRVPANPPDYRKPARSRRTPCHCSWHRYERYTAPALCRLRRRKPFPRRMHSRLCCVLRYTHPRSNRAGSRWDHWQMCIRDKTQSFLLVTPKKPPMMCLLMYKKQTVLFCNPQNFSASFILNEKKR